MTDIKDTLQVQTESAVLGVQELAINIWNAYKAMPPLKQTIVAFLLITMIPAYIGVRVGVEKVDSARYARAALAAHPAFVSIENPVVGPVKIVKNANGTYSAFAEISNPNLDLSADGIPYDFSFKTNTGESAYTTSGTTYLLPNEKKYIVLPRIEVAGDSLASGSLTLGQVNWQKRIGLPQVELRVSEPTLYDESNPLTFIVEGAVVNSSPYDVQTIRLVFVLYDANDKVIGISSRDEYRVPAFGRRAYKQLWPGIYKRDVKKVQVMAYTNTMDLQNVVIEGRAVPTIDDRTIRRR